MISQVFAQNFICKIERSLEIKVNVFNEKGIIIASSSPERVGSFHSAAFHIIQNNLPVTVIEKAAPDQIGVQPGVNYLLKCGGAIIGAIGVSGELSEIKLVAKTIKLTFEVMYEYEHQKQLDNTSRHILTEFSRLLLLESPQNAYKIAKAAENHGFRDDFPRIPVCIVFQTVDLKAAINRFIAAHKSIPDYSSQDIVLPSAQGVFWLKAAARDVYKDFRLYLEQLHQDFKRFFSDKERLSDPSCNFRFAVGPVQTHFADYYSLYQNMKWLEGRITDVAGDIHYLMDYSAELLMQHTSPKVLLPLLHYYCQTIDEYLDGELFRETVSGLIAMNMRIDLTAGHLHMHKNSVVARMNKIRDVLGINPIGNIRDAMLLIQIYDYYTTRH